MARKRIERQGPNDPRFFTEEFFLQQARMMEEDEELEIEDIPYEPGNNEEAVSGGYSEVADQLFNLVDNNKEKVDSFYAMKDGGLQREEVGKWIDTNIKKQELSDLYKDGENTDGFVDWITSNPDYFRQDTDTCIQNDDEAEVDLEDDGSDEDDVASEDELRITDKELEQEDDDIMSDGEDDGSEDDEMECHRFRIYLKHIKPIRNPLKDKVDKDEETVRGVHKKYYILTKAELGTQEMLDELEDELDDSAHATYYDFPNVSLKIYHQNEVELNRIFESLGLECRCRDISHYTDEDERKRVEGQRRSHE